ncbi:hypothetical protein SAMN05444672_101543 [Bacillus sp. OK838]|nr:hypothetical protein SAMN05444672_101543 [Bacillus sp. OK838]
MKADATGIGFQFFLFLIFGFYLVVSARHDKIVQYTACFVEMIIGRTSLE